MAQKARTKSDRTTRTAQKRVVIRSIEGRARALSGVDAPTPKDYERATRSFTRDAVKSTSASSARA